MSEKNETTHWAAQLPIKLHETCSLIRKSENRSKSNLIETALIEYCKKYSEKKAEPSTPPVNECV